MNASQAIAWYNAAAQAAAPAAAQAAASAPANYVIITTSATVAGSQELSQFVSVKELLGSSVRVVTESEWGGGTGDVAAEHIRARLQANYAALGIQYVLLVGDPNPATGDVPMKETWPVTTA